MHYSPLCNFAYRITDDIDQAEDIVQDIFVKVWNDPDLLDGNKKYQFLSVLDGQKSGIEVIRRENISQKINQQLEYIQNNADNTNVEEKR
ncbi:MAG: hypothetical protein IPJ13_01895 [Saprospiraceae bacterium]|nr:hypothetical protein [Saprospiraceae bacterium]